MKGTGDVLAGQQSLVCNDTQNKTLGDHVLERDHVLELVVQWPAPLLKSILFMFC